MSENNSISRRQFLTVAAAGAAAVAVGSSTASAQTAKKTTAAKFKTIKPATEITYWSAHPASTKPVEEEIIRQFQAANPGITVKLETAGANYAEVANKYQQALTAQQIPDIIMLSDVWWFKYATLGALEPVGELNKALNVKVDDYVPALMKDYAWKGEQWAMPWARSTPLFYYNKTMFAKAGLADRAPTTWAEFESWAPKLAEAIGAGDGKAPFTWDKGDSYISWVFQNPVWGRGGSYSKDDFTLTLEDPNLLGACDWLRDSIHVKKWARVATKSAGEDFAAGNTAAVIQSTGGLVGILKAAAGKFEVGTGFLPQGPAFGCPTGGAGLAISKQISDDRKVAAMKFIQFGTAPNLAAFFSASSGYMPVRLSARDGDIMKAKYAATPQLRTAVDQLPKTRSQDVARVLVPGGDSILGKALEKIEVANADPRAAFAEIKPELQRIIDTEVKPRL